MVPQRSGEFTLATWSFRYKKWELHSGTLAYFEQTPYQRQLQTLGHTHACTHVSETKTGRRQAIPFQRPGPTLIPGTMVLWLCSECLYAGCYWKKGLSRVSVLTGATQGAWSCTLSHRPHHTPSSHPLVLTLLLSGPSQLPHKRETMYCLSVCPLQNVLQLPHTTTNDRVSFFFMGEQGLTPPPSFTS